MRMVRRRARSPVRRPEGTSWPVAVVWLQGRPVADEAVGVAVREPYFSTRLMQGVWSSPLVVEDDLDLDLGFFAHLMDVFRLADLE